MAQDTYPIKLDASDLMTPPQGMVPVGDEFRVVNEAAAPDVTPYAECERCGTVFESPIPQHVGIDGHVCTDGYRAHPENQDITEYKL